MGRFFGHFCLLITVIIWGCSFVATKIALGYFSPVEVMALRLLLALPAMVAVLALRGIKPSYRAGSFRALALGSVIIIAHWLIQFIGVSKTTATNTGWLIAVTPLIMAMASALFLHEQLRRTLWLGVVVATAGVALL
ncbi:MAG: DMT family transporter, partial [bacterium]